MQGVAALIVALLTALASPAPPAAKPTGPERPSVEYRDSVAVGAPEAGSLVRGVRFPAEGNAFFTWDPIRHERPNRTWRRWGTDETVRSTLRVLRGFARGHPRAQRVGVGDLSVRGGGDFGPEVGGGIGHATHQNGLDVDVYYPIDGGAERAPLTVEEVDVGLAQDLVDRFVAAGAEMAFVGPRLGLRGPRGVVQKLVHHDDHVHVRWPKR
jgi:murein endopeptidase